MRPRLALVLAAVALASACNDASDASLETTARLALPIIGGTPSDASEDAVVLVVHYEDLGNGDATVSSCTGTLLAPNLVLTARHCVSTTDIGAACDASGRAVSGGEILGDDAPRSMLVFAGKDRPDFSSKDLQPARGVAILTTRTETVCNQDIALILLAEDLVGGVIAPVRLDAPPVEGEPLTVVGWGVTEATNHPATRRRRAGVTVLDVGPIDDLGPAELRTDEGPCAGDSGGPAFAASGAVLGLLSRGGNSTGAAGADGCVGGTNVYTSVAGHAAFLRAGYAKAGYEPWLEGTRNPLLAPNGAACAAHAECQSNGCDDLTRTCAEDCASTACATGTVCAARAGKRLCVAPTPPGADDEGCAVARTGSSGGLSPVIAAFTAAVIFALSRRKNGARMRLRIWSIGRPPNG